MCVGGGGWAEGVWNKQQTYMWIKSLASWWLLLMGLRMLALITNGSNLAAGTNVEFQSSKVSQLTDQINQGV